MVSFTYQPDTAATLYNYIKIACFELFHRKIFCPRSLFMKVEHAVADFY